MIDNFDLNDLYKHIDFHHLLEIDLELGLAYLMLTFDRNSVVENIELLDIVGIVVEYYNFAFLHYFYILDLLLHFDFLHFLHFLHPLHFLHLLLLLLRFLVHFDYPQIVHFLYIVFLCQYPGEFHHFQKVHYLPFFNNFILYINYINLFE